MTPIPPDHTTVDRLVVRAPNWLGDALMALPAIMLLVGHRSAFPTAARVVLMANLAMIALVLYDTLGRQAYAAFMQYSITTLNFIIVVVALAYLRFTRVR